MGSGGALGRRRLAAVRCSPIRQKVRRLDAQTVRKSDDLVERWVRLAALDPGQVPATHVDVVGKGLLANPHLLAYGAQSLTECHPVVSQRRPRLLAR